MLGFAIKTVGLKWNQNGLSILGSSPLLPLGNGPLHLVSDLETCMAFVGLSREKWIASEFNHDKDVYAFLSKSKLFAFQIVQDRLAHLLKKIHQLDVRPVIKQFYWFLSGSNLPALPFDMIQYHQSAAKTFGKESQLNAALEESDRTKLFKEPFGGRIVTKLTGLHGARLGSFISNLRKLCPDEILFRDFILGLDSVPDFIMNEFKKFDFNPD